MKTQQIVVWGEDAIVDAVVKFRRQLGFDKMIRVDYNPNIKHFSDSQLGPGDLIGIRGGGKYLIEVEYSSTNFFTHPKYIRDMIDIIMTLWEGIPRTEWKRKELESKEIINLTEALQRKAEFVSWPMPDTPESREKERQFIEETFG